MSSFCSPALRQRKLRASAFTIVEALVALTIFGVFALGSTATLNFFETRAAQNRNAEAARAVLDDYINYVLDENTPMPSVTAVDADADNNGSPDATLFTSLGTRSLVGGAVPLVVTRTATPTTIVNGTLYWRAKAVGSAFGLSTDTDLMQVSFVVSYQYRGQTAFVKGTTFKART